MQRFKPKSEFSRNAITLMTGTTIAQAIPIAISPILTRIYTPEDFGMFALYTSITSVVAVLATARYEVAVMLPKKNDDAQIIVTLSIFIAFIVSLIVLIIVVLFNTKIATLLGNREIERWLYLSPISIFLTGVYQSLNYWFNRNKEYTLLSKNKIYQTSTTAGVNLTMGVGGFGVSGLIFGTFVGQMLTTSLFVKKYFRESYKIKTSNLKLVAMAKKYNDFPKHSMPTAFLDVISMNAPIYIISKFFSTQVLGFYSFAYRLLQLPSAIIAGAFAQIFYQRFNELSGNPKEQIRLMTSIWKKLFMIGFIPFGIVFIFGEEIFTFVFGSDWQEAGKIASYLSIMIFFIFISSPTSSAFTVLKMQKIGLYFGIFVLFARPLSLCIGYIIESFHTGLMIMVVVEIGQILVYNIMIIRKLRSIKL
jgi:O-antigen/teichoic acid export membrane protein